MRPDHVLGPAAVRCPVVVGRDAERSALSAALTAVRAGHGRTVVLAGPPGIGKSRLARELAAAARVHGLPVLVGRALEARDSTAFRPIREALHAGLRHEPEVEHRGLESFRPALGRLLPQWHQPGEAVDDSLAILGEAVLRLLATWAGREGIVLVLDDLQWADPETLAVVEYLADNLVDERVLLLCTTRERPADADELARRLAARDACTVLPLRPLTPPELTEMALACGGPTEPEVVATLVRRTDGTPLLVEELLSAGGDPASTVPATVAGLVSRRLALLDPAARRCVEAAAVLGERFDWTLIGAAAEIDPSAVVAGLRAAVDDGLVERDGDSFRFHHALGRDAVLAGLLPPERAALAARALTAVTTAHPGLEDGWCDLAADLATTAGDSARSVEVLIEAARRNVAGGALASAEAALRRAAGLLVAGSEPAADVADLLGEVLALAGRTEEAVSATQAALDGLSRRPGADRRLAASYLRLTRVHATAGDGVAADRALAAAREHALRAGDDELRLHVDGVAARVALDASRFAEAEALATAALAGPPATVCDALLVLGRIARREDPVAAERLFARARRLADGAGLAVVAARALHEESISDVQESLRVDRLQAARARARAVGDLAAVAVLDLQLSAVHLTRWEIEEGQAAAVASVAASRRFRLGTLPKALVLGAVAELNAGHIGTAEAALAEALTLAPDDSHLRGEVWAAGRSAP